MKRKNATIPAPDFMTLGEYEEFQKPDRWVPRTIVETPIERAGRAVPNQVKLDSHVASQLRGIVGTESSSFTGTCIGVKDDDGMSWSAEAISVAVAKDFGHFKRWCLSNETTTDSLPLISNLIGSKSFLRLAVEHKLTQSFFSFITLRSWMTPAILLLAVAAGFAIHAAGIIQKMKFPGANQTTGQLFSDPTFYVINISLALLGLFLQFLTTRLTTNTKSKSVEKLVERLSVIENLPKQRFDGFVEALARKMQTVDFPRVVIIDNFEHLDYTTRLVINRYFQKYSEGRSGSEVWYVFEKQDGEKFSSLLLDDLGAYGYKKTKFFEQLVLNEQEKKELVHLIERPEDAAEYITVKRICHPKRHSGHAVGAFYKDYRERHPKDDQIYGELDFFFLLSLTADSVSLTQKFIMKNLPLKSGLPSEALSQFLYGTKLRVEEFRSGWLEIQKKFRSVLILEPDSDSTKLRVIPEKTDMLEEMADELGLPDPGLGHLFWSLLWYDKLQNHPLQAFWMRKLTQHLLKANPSIIKDEQIYISILGRQFDALLFAVDGCMKTCLFRSLRSLLETALNLLHGDLGKTDIDQKRLFKLVRKCWEAYSVLGDEEILTLVLDIYDTTPPGVELEVADDRRLLEKLFFESIPLAPDKRTRLKQDFFTRTYGQPEARQSISDYAQARSAWLSLTSSHQVDSDVNEFVTALIYSDSSIREIAERAFGRIRDASDESVRLTDLMTLSLSLWCSALRFNPAVIETKINAAMKRATADTAVDEKQAIDELSQRLAAISVSLNPLRDFSALIEVAEDGVLLASQVKREATQLSESSIGIDYLMNALAKELCAISLGSVLMASSYLMEVGWAAVEDKQLARINDLIRISNDFLDYTLPEIKAPEDLSSPNLLSKVDSLMKLCGIIWNDFGLDRLGDFMNIRRIHFNAVCMHLAHDDFPAYNSLLQSVGQIINDSNFSGIMANLAISESLKSAEELSVYYLIHAAEIGLSDNFGKQLKDQLCLAAILRSHTYAYELDVFMQHLVAELPGEQSLLHRFLVSVPEDRLEGITLTLLNTSRRASQQENRAKIRDTLTSFVNGIASADVKKKAESLLEVFSTEDKIRDGEAVDSRQLLKDWTDRKNLWLYPWILDILLKNGYSSPEVQKESLSVLGHHNPENDNYNAYFLLSLTLALQFMNEDEANVNRLIPVSYLKQAINKWESHSSAEINLRVYRVLYKLDGEKESYLSAIVRWELIKIEGDHLKHLPRLLGQGRFFLVFQYYFESMAFWGLETDVAATELQAQFNIVPDQKRKLAHEWKASGGVVPSPLTRRGGKLVVSSRFLALGSYLFSAPNYQDRVFDPERQSFDDGAKSKIGDLFRMIIDMPQLPVSIKDLMRGHSQRLLSYTLPAD